MKFNNPKTSETLDKQLESYQDLLDSYRDEVNSIGAGNSEEMAEVIDSMKSAAAIDSSSTDPDAMMVGQLRGLLKMSSIANVDITRELAEASARDGEEIVLIARITPYQLAGIRAVAKMTGSYEKALHAVMDSFGRTAK